MIIEYLFFFQFLAGHSIQKGEDAITRIREEYPNAKGQECLPSELVTLNEVNIDLQMLAKTKLFASQ